MPLQLLLAAEEQCAVVADEHVGDTPAIAPEGLDPIVRDLKEAELLCVDKECIELQCADQLITLKSALS